MILVGRITKLQCNTAVVHEADRTETHGSKVPIIGRLDNTLQRVLPEEAKVLKSVSFADKRMSAYCIPRTMQAELFGWFK